MKRQLIFKQVYYDAQPVSGKTSVSFFTESDDNEESVTKLVEDEAVRWLLGNISFRQLLFEEFFKASPNVSVAVGVTEPFTTKNRKPGDIDLLLVDPDRPDHAIAFECKRVKAVYSNETQTSKVNNAEKIKSGVKQANALRTLGFHQSYLMVIVLDDGRDSKMPNVMFRYSPFDQVERVFLLPWEEPMHEDVGIVFVRVNQTTGKSINLAGGLGICVDKQAKRVQQSTEFTDKVLKLLRSA